MNKDEALAFLKRVAEGIAITFGSSCETLIHDMSKEGHPILAIYNGHVTGREVGSVVDILGSKRDMDEMLTKMDFVNYLATTPEGKQVKSSTFQMVGEDYRYGLGINFDFSALTAANNVLLELMNVRGELQNAIWQAGEGMLGEVMNECMGIIGMNVKDMGKKDKLRLIALLNQKKAFTLQKSVPYISEVLGVSRYTIYKYINEVNGHEEEFLK